MIADARLPEACPPTPPRRRDCEIPAPTSRRPKLLARRAARSFRRIRSSGRAIPRLTRPLWWRLTRPRTIVHAVMPGHRAMTVSVGRGEYCPENYQRRQRESPESKVFSKAPHRTFRARGKVQDKISGDTQGGSRKQRQKVNHSNTSQAPSWCGNSTPSASSPPPRSSSPPAPRRASPCSRLGARGVREARDLMGTSRYRILASGGSGSVADAAARQPSGSRGPLR